MPDHCGRDARSPVQRETARRRTGMRTGAATGSDQPPALNVRTYTIDCGLCVNETLCCEAGTTTPPKNVDPGIAESITTPSASFPALQLTMKLSGMPIAVTREGGRGFDGIACISDSKYARTRGSGGSCPSSETTISVCPRAFDAMPGADSESPNSITFQSCSMPLELMRAVASHEVIAPA